MSEIITSEQVTPHVPNPTGIGGFKPGESGNPGGRPKVSITAEMARYAEWDAIAIELELKRDDLTVKQKIALRQLLNAMEPYDKITNSSVDRVLERLDGKTVQKVEITGTEQIAKTNAALDELLGTGNDNN